MEIVIIGILGLALALLLTALSIKMFILFMELYKRLLKDIHYLFNPSWRGFWSDLGDVAWSVALLGLWVFGLFIIAFGLALLLTMGGII